MILDPELMPHIGRQYPTDKHIFGLFVDASPARWGHILIYDASENPKKGLPGFPDSP